MAFQRRNVLFGILSLPASTLLSGRPLPGLTATVYNGYEFHTAIQAAGPGSSIMLAPGNYGDIGSFILTSSNVSVRVHNAHRAVFRSRLIVNGDFVDLDGLAFEEGVHLAGAGALLSNSKLTGSGLSTNGVNSVIQGNDISRFKGKAIAVSANASNAYVHSNYIHDCLPGAGNAVMVGESTRDTNKQARARVVNNRCVNLASGTSETLSFKCSGNTFSGNQLINCNNITNRHGEGNLIANNRLEKSKGIVVQDARTVVTGNTLIGTREGPGIQIMAGTAAWNAQVQGDHPQAAYTVVRGNNGGLVVGRKYSGYNFPALGTRVESHSGPISLQFHSGTSMPGGKATTVGDDGGGGKKKSSGAEGV